MAICCGALSAKSKMRRGPSPNPLEKSYRRSTRTCHDSLREIYIVGYETRRVFEVTRAKISMSCCIGTRLVLVLFTLNIRTFSELKHLHSYLETLNRDALRGDFAENLWGFKRMSGTRHVPEAVQKKKFPV